MAPLQVIDASVLVGALVDTGPEGRWAEERLEDASLAAPQLVLVEATNILRRLEIAGEITDLEAGMARRDLLQLRIELYPFPPLADRIWELRRNITAYDAWYVALAESLEAPLVTLDRRLVGAPGSRCGFRVPEG